MTTKTDAIKLPPLPEFMADIAAWLEVSSDAEVARDILNYARAAVEADRQGRMPSEGGHLRWALRECGVSRSDSGAFFGELALGKLAALLARYSSTQPAASAEPIYAFRRKGQDEFVTCGPERFAELQAKSHLFEARIFYAAPVAQEPVADAATTLAAICDLFGIGSAARDPGTILANVENAVRRSACLGAVESHLTVSTPPDPDEGDDEPGEECLLRWGAGPEGYAEQFKDALKKFGYTLAAPVAQEPVARDWPSIQSAIDEYLDGYELIGEPGDHTPTEFEKFLLTDAIAGLLDDEKFLGLFAAPIAAQAQPTIRESLKVAQDHDAGLADTQRAIIEAAERRGYERAIAECGRDLEDAHDIEAAAKTLAECMDYPWEPMPKKGREEMRKHAKRVIDAALAAKERT